MKADAKGADVCTSLPMRWQNIAKADDVAVNKHHGRRNMVEHEASIEGKRFRGWGSLGKYQEALLACHGVEHGAETIEVWLCERNNLEVHDAQTVYGLYVPVHPARRLAMSRSNAASNTSGESFRKAPVWPA